MTAIDSSFSALARSAHSPSDAPARISSAWAFQVYRGDAGLESLRNEWRDCLEQSTPSTYLQSPEWFSAYLKAIAPRPRNVHLVAARHRNRLAGVFVVESAILGSAGFGVPVLQLISGNHMHLSDVGVPAGAPNAWAEFDAWLHAQRDVPWQVFLADRVCGDSSLAGLLAQPGSNQTLSVDCQGTPTRWLDCSQDLAHALRNVSKSHCGNIKRLTRRARELGTLSYEAVTDPDRLDAALQHFLQVEASGWKAGAGSAINLHPNLVAFYRQLSREFGARGECRINLLRLNGEVIAAQFGLISNRQLNLLKIGFANQHAALAPGNLIMQHTIESVCADAQLARLSFVTDPPWAHLWKPQATPCRQFAIFRRSPTGRLMYWGLRLWRARPRWGIRLKLRSLLGREEL
jgi:CelD/BcsL family acetyltransferase involved in cellulose biosynthesis